MSPPRPQARTARGRAREQSQSRQARLTWQLWNDFGTWTRPSCGSVWRANCGRRVTACAPPSSRRGGTAATLPRLFGGGETDIAPRAPRTSRARQRSLLGRTRGARHAISPTRAPRFPLVPGTAPATRAARWPPAFRTRPQGGGCTRRSHAPGSLRHPGLPRCGLRHATRLAPGPGARPRAAFGFLVSRSVPGSASSAITRSSGRSTGTSTGSVSAARIN